MVLFCKRQHDGAGVYQAGFTLVEIMIALFISGLIMAGIFTVYTSQRRTFDIQDQVDEMQLNLRAPLDVMVREIRMAGYDPKGTAGAGITTASVGQFGFTSDFNGDGDTADYGEIIDYGFSDVAGDDADRDGVPDNGGVLALARRIGGATGTYQPIAENIERIEFRYLDFEGKATTVAADVRTVQISLLARTGREDSKFTNTMTYTPASEVNWDLNGAAAGVAANDHFRRRVLITAAQIRNL
jgi:type IV pilus assembly protein PilW